MEWPFYEHNEFQLAILVFYLFGANNDVSYNL